jgi:hypothetical protein
MSTGNQRWTETEFRRAIRAAKKEGVADARVEVEPRTGKISVVLGEPQPAASQPTANEWDAKATA